MPRLLFLLITLLVRGLRVALRARRFLCRRHKLRPQGASRFAMAEIYGSAGVLDLQRHRKQRREVNAYS
jgi:hypothetical protein